MESKTLRVSFVLEAVVCDHCDTFFGVPKHLEQRPFFCPLGHRNAGREWSAPDQQRIDDAIHRAAWEAIQRIAAAAVCEVNPSVERGFVVGYECSHGDYWESYDAWSSHVGESVASGLVTHSDIGGVEDETAR